MRSMVPIDIFMAIAEIFATWLTFSIDTQSIWTAFMRACCVILSILWAVMTILNFNDMYNSFISTCLLTFSLMLLIINIWYSHHIHQKARKKIKILLMTPLQRQKYYNEKRAAAQKKQRKHIMGKGRIPGLD